MAGGSTGLPSGLHSKPQEGGIWGFMVDSTELQLSLPSLKLKKIRSEARGLADLQFLQQPPKQFP